MSEKPEINVISPQVRDALSRAAEYSQFTKELYSVCIYDLNKFDLLSNPYPLSIGPASSVNNTTTPEYTFKLPPKVLEVAEPFATNIQVTQSGGKYIESQGSPLKEIRVSGTTGFRPHRNDAKSLKIFGLDTGITGPLSAVADFAGIGTSPDLLGTVKSVADVFTKPSPWPKGESLGYDDITFLRNLFRLYAWHKENAENVSSVVMLWRNVKDADYWLVEPLEFRLSQNSSSPLTYEYNITFKTLAKWDYKVALKEDPMQFLRDVRNLYARVNQTTAIIKQSFLFIASRIDKFAMVPKNISEFILGPIASVIQGSAAVKKSSKRFSDVFSANVLQLKQNVKEYIGLCEDVFPVQSEEVNALRKILRATELLLADSELNSSNIINSVISSKVSTTNLYSTSLSGVSSGISAGASGSTAFIGNQSLGNTISQDIVKEDDNIRTLAYRLLGDSTKYHILVLLNNLQSPYVSIEGGEGILKPGDSILFPSQSQISPNSLISSPNQSDNETLNSSVSSVDQQYGRDLRLKKSNTGGSIDDLLDFDLNQNKDLSTVVGIENITQAIKLKFSIKRGELPAHQFYGALFPMGTKATPASLAGFRVGVEQTLLSDERIDSIRSLNFSIVGDTLSVNTVVNITNSGSGLRLGFPIRDL